MPPSKTSLRFSYALNPPLAPATNLENMRLLTQRDALPGMPFQLPGFFNPRHRSLIRGNILVWGSVVLAVAISRFPHTRATLLQLIPSILSVAGTADTLRCIRKRWSLYHAGVLFCLYMDLMAVCVILFLLVYPFTYVISS